MQLAALALLALLLLAPEASQACAVCFSGRDETRVAFLVTTILMTLLPLAMIGALVLWLRQRVRAAAQAAAEASVEPRPTSSASS